MDKILKAVKCVECREVLEIPLILPCNHSICKKHVIDKDTIICSRCGVEHKNAHFPMNEALADIIASKVMSIDFGRIHKKATESCNRLEIILKKAEDLLKDPNVFIYDEINGLRNEVQWKSEQLKLKIDEETEKIHNNLTEYENRCKSLLVNEGFLRTKNKFELKHNALIIQLSKFKGELNEIKHDKNKWRKISKATNQATRNLEEDLELFKDDILLNEIDIYKSEVNYFRDICIDQLFQFSVELLFD